MTTSLPISSSNTERRSSYRHEALPNASRYMRLLELQTPATWESDSTPSCTLTTTLRDTAPGYHAISYTWGDPLPSHSVRVGEGLLWLPKSTVNVLKQLASIRSCRYYWIDSICIDQSNLEEKSGQVAIMGGIYEEASQVLVCLNNADDKAEDAMRMVEELEAHHAYPITNECFQVENTWPPKRRLFTTFALAQLRFASDIFGARVKDLLLGLVALSERPWFSRIWVVQELLLARSAFICCGVSNVPAAVLHKYFRLVQYTATLLMSKDDQVQQEVEGLRAWTQEFAPDLCKWVDWSVTLERLSVLAHHVESLGLKPRTARKMPPREILQYVSSRYCSESRDSVYGMLGITDWTGCIELKPDYSKSTFRLAIDYLHCGRDRHFGVDAHNLVKRLGVSFDDEEVQEAIAARSNGAQMAEADGWMAPSAARANTVHCSFCGLELTTEMYQQITPTEYIIRHRKLNLECTIFAMEVQPGDWFVFEDIEARDDHQGFIVRPNLDTYCIVGRAFLPCPLERLDVEIFSIIFDPEDFVVSMCVGLYLSRASLREPCRLNGRELEILGIPVCRRPFSSYAQLDGMPCGDLEPETNAIWEQVPFDEDWRSALPQVTRGQRTDLFCRGVRLHLMPSDPRFYPEACESRANYSNGDEM